MVLDLHPNPLFLVFILHLHLSLYRVYDLSMMCTRYAKMGVMLFCRILEYLLQLHSAELRREVLPDAFESQPEASQQGYEESSEGHKGDNEQLSTTPLQLLQVNASAAFCT